MVRPTIHYYRVTPKLNVKVILITLTHINIKEKISQIILEN